MDKYISYTIIEECLEKLERNAQNPSLESHYRIGYLVALDDAKKEIKNHLASKGKFVKRVNGNWSDKPVHKNGKVGYRCSVCKEIHHRTLFCSGCGAIMRNFEEESENEEKFES